MRSTLDKIGQQFLQSKQIPWDQDTRTVFGEISLQLIQPI